MLLILTNKKKHHQFNGTKTYSPCENSLHELDRNSAMHYERFPAYRLDSFVNSTQGQFWHRTAMFKGMAFANVESEPFLKLRNIYGGCHFQRYQWFI